mmetsp:Transcript_45777/g.113741  ORF Transcript_45777/g.113741 Transcript_45777/m.113741 type:complete len:222 (+) Transcript_45777:122-787(+)
MIDQVNQSTSPWPRHPLTALLSSNPSVHPSLPPSLLSVVSFRMQGRKEKSPTTSLQAPTNALHSSASQPSRTYKHIASVRQQVGRSVYTNRQRWMDASWINHNWRSSLSLFEIHRRTAAAGTITNRDPNAAALRKPLSELYSASMLLLAAAISSALPKSTSARPAPSSTMLGVCCRCMARLGRPLESSRLLPLGVEGTNAWLTATRATRATSSAVTNFIVR